ncbi:MAG: glutamine--fructose-6-phosphate transaminase (isomerizing) [Nitrosospira sp.]|nr:glutamine--fructose-6-phosphate transaminase (isomerizing) [Nitrosospira sp.]MDW7642601.1 glutamine--fructose-6-phosphate transaminase (isomerizing) [Nitrosomonadaceae bacterium]MBI0415644.1 glutamine--fructose-6-phosphate transaminase (isomerizing) [Nitrosospira sp.]MDW7652874.1 glutamine--fructose-6-phosphate transaminase (isomerizing) [Nitrosomonadaceae bacterium]MDW7664078.1 glutamine--fructose-6-phosphate transaminase (isomerizing) [Nitrosomonadaceae bacterium]
MCGIVVAVAKNNVASVLLEGLSQLEYRGYDSAGIALMNGGFHRLRTTGRVAELNKIVNERKLQGKTGIAHTRWATHGEPSEHNAHPHFSGEASRIAVVHNGIIENYETLRQRLQAAGLKFISDTDTEVIAHLITFNLERTLDLFEAVRDSVTELQGIYAIAVMEEARPDRIVVFHNGTPLLLGLGTSGNYAASDASALIQVTKRIIYLKEGDLAELYCDSYRIVNCFNGSMSEVDRIVHESKLTTEDLGIGSYAHFMQKEIFEQPSVAANILEEIFNTNSVSPQLFGDAAKHIFTQIDKVLILACGTSYHAGLVARHWLETVAKLTCNVEIASEYRYRNPVIQANTLVVGISQSGETADTLAALSYAKAFGHRYSLAICNVAESTLTRQTDLCFLTRAGPEIGVASTKAFTTQLTGLMLLAVVLGKLHGKLSNEDESKIIGALRHLPVSLNRVLRAESEIKVWAKKLSESQHILFLGRGIHYPIAMEGALKLKEISYIHAEAYAAGELKHGPLALIDKDMPVIVIAPNDELLAKIKSNLQEVRARGGKLYVLADNDSSVESSSGLEVIRLTEYAGLLSPILHTIPLQLLAYHIALIRNTDIDKPRNLAKSVTVE